MFSTEKAIAAELVAFIRWEISRWVVVCKQLRYFWHIKSALKLQKKGSLGEEKDFMRQQHVQKISAVEFVFENNFR